MLNYKQYQLLRRPAEIQHQPALQTGQESSAFEEEESVPAFASRLAFRGKREWWRRAMGFRD